MATTYYITYSDYLFRWEMRKNAVACERKKYRCDNRNSS